MGKRPVRLGIRRESPAWVTHIGNYNDILTFRVINYMKCFQVGVRVLHPAHRLHGPVGLLLEEQVQAQAAGDGNPVRTGTGQEYYAVLGIFFLSKQVTNLLYFYSQIFAVMPFSTRKIMVETKSEFQ